MFQSIIRPLRTKALAGFTLAELIVVVTILAILATVGFLALSGYSEDAKDARSKTNVRSVYSAINAESALSGNSPRYYVVHDSNWALSGAVVAFGAVGATTLTWGDWNAPNTNYSAGNPDFAKLKLNADKFKTSFFETRFASTTSAAGTVDPLRPIVGAADVTEFVSGGKVRVKNLIQVAWVPSSGGTAVVIGNYPTGLSGSVSGLVKDASSWSLTGALLDGSKPGSVGCAAATWSGFAVPSMSDGGVSTVLKTVTNGTGSLSASCSYGNTSYWTVSGICSPGFSWSGATLTCSQTSFIFNKAISANVQNYNLKSDAIAAGWNQTLPISATVTVGTGVIVGSANTSSYAFDTGTGFPVGSTLSLVNHGYIVGAGGRGGDGNQGGSGNLSCTWCVYPTAWGGALKTTLASNVHNLGTIGGGGGGGSWGGGMYNGYWYAWGGGGGGAGSVPGSTGNNGGMSATNGTSWSLTSWGSAGGNSNGGGLPGSGGWLGMSGWACVGYIGSLHGSCGALGGAAGVAVNGIGNVVFVLEGTVLGPRN